MFIGSEGDGPAISLGGNISKGRTNACKTFNSPILIDGGEKHKDDDFVANNIEVFIL